MKVIFLDIDGVLNSEDFALFLRKYNREHDVSWLDSGGNVFIDPKAVKRVIRLCKKNDYKIVISSSWRLYSLNDTKEDFLKYRDLSPINEYIVGITPRLRTSDDRYYSRGEEIQDYLDNHPEVEQYCIVDDDNDMLVSQMKHFIRIDNIHGLTNNDCGNIKSILEQKFDVLQPLH